MKSAVCILCQRDNLSPFVHEYLAVSRRGNPTQWGLPGGKVDKGEANYEAMARELVEETGIGAADNSFEPIFCGIARGEVDYWVTTYLWTDEEYPIEESEIRPEAGLLVEWKTEAELCDDNLSPFAEYNRRVFAAFKERTDK